MFDFGNHLRMLRERYGISQEELGRRVGRAGSVISNYENNLKLPSLDVLITMSEIYNDLVHRLIKELKQSTRPVGGGLSAEQQVILNLIMKEFSK